MTQYPVLEGEVGAERARKRQKHEVFNWAAEVEALGEAACSSSLSEHHKPSCSLGREVLLEDTGSPLLATREDSLKPRSFSLQPSDWPLQHLKWPALTAQSESDLLAMSLNRARSSVIDFVRSYFMFHGLEANNKQAVMLCLPTLALVESYIYALDDLSEDLLEPQGTASLLGDENGKAAKLRDDEVQEQSQVGDLRIGKSEAATDFSNERTPVISGSRSQSCEQEAQSLSEGAESDDSLHAFKPMQALLANRNLLTDDITFELQEGLRFWQLERQLCTAMMSVKSRINAVDKLPFTRADVERALRLKSFDYRVMNLLLYKMRCAEPDKDHLAFLEVSELLVEVADDLFDYEEDVLKNSFNVYRLFIFLYGPSQAPIELADYISNVETEYHQRMSKLDPTLARTYERRCLEATQSGGDGKEGRSPLGAWILPAPILNETAYRKRCLN